MLVVFLYNFDVLLAWFFDMSNLVTQTNQTAFISFAQKWYSFCYMNKKSLNSQIIILNIISSCMSFMSFWISAENQFLLNGQYPHIYSNLILYIS